VSGYVVGLTGGIGSGKSAAADCFAAHGAAVVDTDAIAHELTAPGGAAMPALRAAFGDDIATPAGALDRARMRQLAFADSAVRARLEGILHPHIRTLADARCQAAASPYVILAVPLLVESGGYRERCDRIAVVDCAEAVQVARVMARNGIGEADVRAIMAAQATRAQRLAAADDVIDNSGTPAQLGERVRELHGRYLALAAAKLKANC
jgi:dephospho-CoA kinase